MKVPHRFLIVVGSYGDVNRDHPRPRDPRAQTSFPYLAGSGGCAWLRTRRGGGCADQRRGRLQTLAVEHIGIALAGARELQAAVKAGDVTAAQGAWIKSRKGWEAAEPITGEFFSKLDEAIDAWPDAKQGYHAIEAALFSGKLGDIGAPVEKLVADLTEFDKQISAPRASSSRHRGCLNGATKLAYELGENKSKGGESPLCRHLAQRHV